MYYNTPSEMDWNEYHIYASGMTYLKVDMYYMSNDIMDMFSNMLHISLSVSCVIMYILLIYSSSLCIIVYTVTLGEWSGMLAMYSR